jgi:general secretion pathway protein D
VLGNLFRARSRSRKKTNLVVFLRPYVMRDEAAANQRSLDRYDFIRARQKEIPADPHDLLKDAPMPLLSSGT